MRSSGRFTRSPLLSRNPERTPPTQQASMPRLVTGDEPLADRSGLAESFV
jgi:hypothetical protein